ncbi:hypothetical protein R3P38DRAFT_3492643 [Favolaschia claudopus]|uniref:Uncharacterized protein n=1 Tax=Favolaschia claudopus TaxID=2862362 RepID=A0AAW0EDW7_9AGAR
MTTPRLSGSVLLCPSLRRHDATSGYVDIAPAECSRDSQRITSCTLILWITALPPANTLPNALQPSVYMVSPSHRENTGYPSPSQSTSEACYPLTHPVSVFLVDFRYENESLAPIFSRVRYAVSYAEHSASYLSSRSAYLLQRYGYWEPYRGRTHEGEDTIDVGGSIIDYDYGSRWTAGVRTSSPIRLDWFSSVDCRGALPLRLERSGTTTCRILPARLSCCGAFAFERMRCRVWVSILRTAVLSMTRDARRAMSSSHGKDVGTMRLRFVEGCYAGPLRPSRMSCFHATCKHATPPAASTPQRRSLSMPPPPPWVSDHENGGVLIPATATTDVRLGVLYLFVGSPFRTSAKFSSQLILRRTSIDSAPMPARPPDTSSTTLPELPPACDRTRRADGSPCTQTCPSPTLNKKYSRGAGYEHLRTIDFDFDEHVTPAPMIHSPREAVPHRDLRH